MDHKRLGILVVLGIALVPLAGFAECGEDEQACADAKPTRAEAEERSGYTWEELVEQVPSLKQYELGFQRSTQKDAGDDEGTYVICRKVQANNSRIKKRVCMPLADALALAAEQSASADRQRLDFLDRQNQRPYSTINQQRN